MNKLTETEFIDRLNEIIKEQEGKELTIEDKLIDSGMDSFSYAFFWAYVQDEFPMFTDEYINSIDYAVYMIKDMVNKYESN